MPRPKGSPETIEARRHQALRLLDEGYSLNEVGRLVGCAASSVMRWRDARRRGGKKALKARTPPGRPGKLTRDQQKKLVKVLLKGALANGYETELWTTQRIAEVIRRVFGIEYHRDHIGRLLHKLGWSCQKPDKRALERKEAEIRRWKKEKWPRLKKTLRGWAPTSSLSTKPASS